MLSCLGKQPFAMDCILRSHAYVFYCDRRVAQDTAKLKGKVLRLAKDTKRLLHWRSKGRFWPKAQAGCPARLQSSVQLE